MQRAIIYFTVIHSVLAYIQVAINNTYTEFSPETTAIAFGSDWKIFSRQLSQTLSQITVYTTTNILSFSVQAVPIQIKVSNDEPIGFLVFRQKYARTISIIRFPIYTPSNPYTIVNPPPNQIYISQIGDVYVSQANTLMVFNYYTPATLYLGVIPGRQILTINKYYHQNSSVVLTSCYNVSYSQIGYVYRYQPASGSIMAVTQNFPDYSKCLYSYLNSTQQLYLRVCPYIVQVFEISSNITYRAGIIMDLNQQKFDNYVSAIICSYYNISIYVVLSQKFISFYDFNQTNMLISAYPLSSLTNPPISVTNQLKCLSDGKVGFEGFNVLCNKTIYYINFRIVDSATNLTGNLTVSNTTSTANCTISNPVVVPTNNTTQINTINSTSNNTNNQSNGNINASSPLNISTNSINNSLNNYNYTMNQTNSSIFSNVSNYNATNNFNATINNTRYYNNTISNLNVTNATNQNTYLLDSFNLISVLESTYFNRTTTIIASTASVISSIPFMREALKPFSYLIEQLWYYGTHSVRYTDFVELFIQKADLLNELRIKPAFLQNLNIDIIENINMNYLYTAEGSFHDRVPDTLFFLFAVQDIYTFNLIQTCLLLFATYLLSRAMRAMKENSAFYKTAYKSLSNSLQWWFQFLVYIQNNLANIAFFSVFQLCFFSCFDSFAKFNLVLTALLFFLVVVYCFSFYSMLFRYSCRGNSKNVLNVSAYCFQGFWLQSTFTCHRRFYSAFAHAIFPNRHSYQLAALILFDIVVMAVIFRLSPFFKRKFFMVLLLLYFLGFLMFDIGLLVGTEFIYSDNLDQYRGSLFFSYFSIIVILHLCGITFLQIFGNIVISVLNLFRHLCNSRKVKDKLQLKQKTTTAKSNKDSITNNKKLRHNLKLIKPPQNQPTKVKYKSPNLLIDTKKQPANNTNVIKLQTKKHNLNKIKPTSKNKN